MLVYLSQFLCRHCSKINKCASCYDKCAKNKNIALDVRFFITTVLFMVITVAAKKSSVKSCTWSTFAVEIKENSKFGWCVDDWCDFFSITLEDFWRSLFDQFYCLILKNMTKIPQNMFCRTNTPGFSFIASISMAKI